MIRNRVFVSFDEPCYYQCKHCYTYGINRNEFRSMEKIVDSISNEAFDIIYVSQKTDNFSDPSRGLELCEKLFEKYEKDMFIITRSIFDGSHIERLLKLKYIMSLKKKNLFIAISLNALSSNYISEDPCRVSSPSERIRFLDSLAKNGLNPILMLRPIFPNSIIPIEECLQIIERCSKSVSCVVSSELGVNEDVLSRLSLKWTDFEYLQDNEYLQGAIDCKIDFINVRKELLAIKNKCIELKCNYFKHSIPALNFLLQSMAM